MSQYGILWQGYGSSASFMGDVSGITLTINPLAMTQSNYYGQTYFDDPLSVDNSPGGSNTFSLISNSINAWASYINSDPNVNSQLDLTAGSPVFWVLNIAEIRNPRLLALFNSNASGWGHDVRFYLEGRGGRWDTTGNTNHSRTSDALFTHILDPWFQTANVTPFTAGTLAEQTGVGILGNVWDVYARALNPYAFLNDGEGNAQALNDWSGNADTDRCVDRMFVTKEPTLSYVQTSGAFSIDSGKDDYCAFDLVCEVYESGSWNQEGAITKAVQYRSVSASQFDMNNNMGQWPWNEHIGCYVDWNGGQLHEGITFTWYTDSVTIPNGNNMNLTSWQDAFFDTPTARICGAPVLTGKSEGYSGTFSQVHMIRNESQQPDRLFGGLHNSMSCGLYWNTYPLTTGMGWNWMTHIDDVARDKAIFGYDKLQGLHDLYNDCNHADASVANTTSNNQLRSVDHREFWYSWQPILENEACWSDNINQTGSPVAIHPTSFMLNQPTCGNSLEWESIIIEHEYIPAPIWDGNIDQVYFTRVRANNMWNVPGGVTNVILYLNATSITSQMYDIDTNITTINIPPMNSNGSCAAIISMWYMEPKSVCSLYARKDAPSAALLIDDWEINVVDETCGAQGSIEFEFDWKVPCTAGNSDGEFYSHAPNDYSFDVKLHLSLGNTGSVTHTVSVNVNESNMNFNSSTASGDQSGTFSATLSLPCGHYWNHSIEVTPMTSSMFVMGQPGQGHTWNTGSGGTTWPAFTNSDNHVGCATGVPTLSCSTTDQGCGTLGTFTGTWSSGTGPFAAALVNSSFVVVGNASGITSPYTFTGLAADGYGFTLTDSAGCTAYCSGTISNIGGSLTVSETIVDPTYCILSDGSANLSVSGGTGPYTVVWTNNTTSATLPYTGVSASQLPPGTYDYIITDVNGCSDSGQIVIPAAPALGMDCGGSYIMDTSGAGNNDGYLVISIDNISGSNPLTGGLGVYTPQVVVTDSTGLVVSTDSTWASFNNFFGGATPATAIINNLPPETYTVVVTFCPNITANGTTISVAADDCCELTCTFVCSDPGAGGTCNGGAIVDDDCAPGPDTGTIDVTATGGSTNSFHHWEFTLCTDAAMTMGCQTFVGTSTYGDNTTGAAHTFTALANGTYYATVTACYNPAGTICLPPSAVTSPLVVGQIGGPTFTLTQTNPTCPGVCDGAITQVTTGGTAPYLYYIWDSGGSIWMPPTGTTWAGLTPGGLCTFGSPYTYQVVDANGCAATDSVTFIDPPAIDFTQAGPNPVVTPATCGANDGSFVFTFATGGTITVPMLGCTYTLYDGGGTQVAQQLGTGSVTNTFTGLAPDNYTLTATDSNGCEESITVIIGTASFSLTNTKSDQGCNFPPSSDGSITLSIAPWANIPLYAYTIATSGPGGYTDTYTIAGPGFPVADYTQTGLQVGVYNITVMDGNGCTANLTETIVAGTDLQENLIVTEIPMACPTGCGELHFTNTTGDFPLWIEISSDAGATWIKVSTVINSTATAFTSLDLLPPLGVEIDNFTYYQENTSNRWCFQMGNTYHIRLRGTSSPYCPSATIIYTMATTSYVPMVHTETITQPTCCACNSVSCNGAITNTISNGVPIPQGVAGTHMSYDWTLKYDGILIASQVGAVITGPQPYVVSSTQGTPTNEEFDIITFAGLYPGDYEFCSTDSCNVTMCETWTIIDPRVYVIDIITSQPMCTYGCDDGTIEVVASGGSSGTYQFSMDDGITWHPAVATASTSYTFTGVGPGTWNIWARDPICGVQTLFDTSDNVLTTAPGCYSDFITGIWPVGTQTTLAPVSDLNTQWVSLTNNSLPGSSDGAITVNILGGIAPYEVSVSTSANHQACDLCVLQTAGVISPGLNQYIDINGAAVSATGITTVAANGALVIDNLSVSLDFSGTALGAWYTIVIKDAAGCFSCISKYIDNGTLGIIAIYSAEDCNCNCPTGYALIEPAPAPPALPCAGTSPDAPSFLGAFNAPNSIQQFGGNNLTSGSYGTSGARLYIPTGGSATTFTAVSTADTFTKTDLGLIAGFPGQFISAGSGIVLEVALDAMMVPQTYGSIFNTRLWDAGTWPQQSNPNNVIAVPTNEWIGIPIELSFGSPQLCILGFTADGDYKITLNCGTFLTSEFVVNGGTQNIAVDLLNLKEYVMMPVLIPDGEHTLTFWVKNNTTNASADQVAGIAFDLFQGSLSSGLSTTSVFAGATTQAQLDPYYILDINGKKVTSRNVTAGVYEHDFLMGDTIGYQCASNCVIMDNGNITCLSNDTADCTMPIDCPEFLSDLVECLGTLSNEVYDKMIAGLLENKLDVREVWLVLLTKYLIKNLNPCVTLQDLLSWAKFLEDICPDCENNFEGSRPAIDPNAGTPYGGGNGMNTYDF